MIPRILNYIWLSGEKRDEIVSACLETWRRTAPDYEIRCWTARDFDFSAMSPFVREALSAGKWAFASDYLRHWVLYHHGGWYLDSDVVMFRSPERYRSCRYVAPLEFHPEVFDPGSLDADGSPAGEFVPGIGIQSAVLGCEKGHPFARDCMDWYRDRHFEPPFRPGAGVETVLAPDIQASVARRYGFEYRVEEQYLDEGIVVPDVDRVAAGVSLHTNRADLLHIGRGGWKNAAAVSLDVAELVRVHDSIENDERGRCSVLKAELDGLMRSMSFRLGRKLTFPVRCLMGGLREVSKKVR